jgi:hypothetical protein
MEIMTLLNWLMAQDTEKLLTVTVVISLLYSLYSNYSNPRIAMEQIKIHSRYDNILNSYIRDTLLSIHVKSMRNAREIIKNIPKVECEHLCNNDPLQIELSLYDARLYTVLNRNLKDQLLMAIDSNGYHHFSDAQLNTYYQEKGSLLHAFAQETLQQYSYEISHILSSDVVRFTQEEAIKCFSDIIKYKMELEKDEEKDIMELKKKYSLSRFIKFKKK